ncbi:hypothetical protein SY88_02930 [Clostridiales bacterium PH28_bin88]|nr:hypothetical protein SY88_02930 [Clostridiales bacterium PH28_bin88]
MEYLGQIWVRNATLYPNKHAFVYGDRKITFSELNRRANRLCNAMSERGIRKGDRVAILSKNNPEYWEVYGLAEKGGIILVPLNWRLAAKEIKYLLVDSGARAVIVSKEYAGLINSLRPDLAAVEEYICIEGGVPGMEDYETVLAEGSPEEPEVGVTGEDICYIIYSSGTSGLPKGIVLTHRGQVENAKAQILELRSGVNDIYLAVVPLFHSGGKGVTLAFWYRGCTVVVAKEFNPREVLETIARERVTATFMVPAMVAFMLNLPDFAKYDVSSLRTLFYAGSPMPLDLLRRAMEAFGHILCQGYGLAESGPLATYLSKEDHLFHGTEAEVKRSNSCGKPAPGAEVKVVDADGKEVLPGEIGEIIIRSNRLMSGYWKQPDKTAETIRNGWLYTGDMATVDAEGYIYIVDRKNDLIISGGENIYPREIEEVLYTHPAVLEAAVIGVPDEKWGEAIKAFIALKESASATEEEIIDYCKQYIASYKKPRSVEFLPELPKNPSGKVLRNVLRRKYWEGRQRNV